MPGVALTVILFVIILIILPGVRVVRQFERGVVFTLGKYTGMRNPGLQVVIPYLQTMTRVDVRSTPIDVPKQEVINYSDIFEADYRGDYYDKKFKIIFCLT